MSVWRCMICVFFVAFSLKILLSHINVTHGRNADFWVFCGIDGCEQEFRVFNSFYRHLKRTHPLYVTSGCPPMGWRTTPSAPPLLENFGVSIFGDSETPSMDGSVELSPDERIFNTGPDPPIELGTQEPREMPEAQSRNAVIPTSVTRPDIARSAAAFAISVREQCHLSQRTVNNIITRVQQYQATLLETLRNEMREVFEEHGGTSTQLRDAALATFDHFIDPFSTTAYRQDRAISELLSPVSAEEVAVSQTICRVKQGSSKVMAIRKRSFYYVPLIESLKQLLSDSRIFTMLNAAPPRSRAGFLYDFFDGDIFINHPLYSMKPNALQIILYTDEIEICNPLGSYASQNKLLMVYYSLGNIDPKFRSKLAAIRLLAIAKAEYVSKWGIDVVLQRIQKDVELLYNGVKIETSNGDMDLYGAVIAVCGDTLAQHELAGFKEGVGFAYSKCRHCECTFEDMQTSFDENEFVRRTQAKHIRQCLEIDKATTDNLKAHLKTTYGINRRSRLVDFPAFDLINQTPQDIMHIIFEGVAPMEIKLVLKKLILSGDLELDAFNSAIQNFPYSSVDVRDKPCPISVTTLTANDNKLKQSCGQMLIFLKILPFLLRDVDNEYVKFINKLIEIVQIVLAPVISLQTISRLKIIIEEHLNQFKHLFPESNVIPKQHYMLHLPSQIKSLGPLIRCMCMRFEAKHSYFKQWASKLNFKNVCKSLARHNQFLECCQNEIGCEHPIFANERELGPMSEVRNIQYIQAKFRDFLGMDSVENVVSVKWLILNGNKYISGKSLIITHVEDNLPVFGLVKGIFIVNSSFVAFETMPYETLAFDNDLRAYKVIIPALAQATDLVHELIDHTSYYSVTFKENVFVPIKYNLSDIIAHGNGYSI
ncbi:hypothetical protein ACEWY4_001449 [Coilia grayii]|uniref:C2H2-type domain-containing protein n=1 Tax=Coilia grayii TaxID=363190 RepID=A0ABD1KSY7_9TELE